ncbi:hypothetical protein PGH07_04745 [Sulfurovum sp. zt1-1]|uniref:Uncharacterized protein n=1 Tax=Sulfurovum zhangzhouensis TaxID=3019067 RepID=A0ABT7QXC2_9BACT|nr:hypothetical protein [Sulfurovum zhangzhouensis]MDM5271478.1 hypothetical protein [Sulfurovum zhangzhouensis]
MKKALLLSVVASSMILAGGDIAPVEPAVEAPAEVSSWEFSGTGVVYYQTTDTFGETSLFDQESSAADAGIQLRATNSDVVAGIGAGFEVSGLSTLNLENWLVSDVMQGTGWAGDIDDVTDGGWISQAYLTYGFGNTSIKAGRQELPKGLSPFAFSEDWNVFKNTFDAVLVVNTDLPDTTLVGAWVAGGNFNSMFAGMNNMTDFNSLNGKDGVWMLTAQNKSIANLTLTGSFYYAADMLGDDASVLWGDAQYDAGNFGVGIQGGTMMSDAFADDMAAFGAKVSADFSGINAMAAYSTVNDGGMGMVNFGGMTSALYTDLLADQFFGFMLRYDADKFVVKAGMDALGGNISAAYGYTDSAIAGKVNEFDLGYGVNVATGFDLNLAYAYVDIDDAPDAINVVRVIGTYNF